VPKLYPLIRLRAQWPDSTANHASRVYWDIPHFHGPTGAASLRYIQAPDEPPPEQALWL